MSLLSAVEEAIKTYKVEQAKLNRTIQYCREILQNLKPQHKAGSEETELADDAAADAESSPGEKEDIELLERALEKALWVRTVSEFPNDWPCGSPDETRFQLHRLTEQGLSLALRCRTEEILVKQPSEMKPEVLGGEQSKSPSSATLEQLQLTAAELHVFADKVKREWKAWDRWRPEGGCLCPSEAAGVFGNRTASPLPLTITYRTEPELQLLERLRMRVALLQQEIHLEQVLLDALSHQLSSIRPGPGCPSPSVLRDIYSLLGEGGERFAAFIHDSKHE
ncbi:tubulin epsilon and delta complex protein 2-like isoform X2 [Girardinichthys multiradiatus]|uniref:tubulin epsilon and delta complex protein 2-like isoform X2 n=1 Tax=Girardinichthys multiradiatus TaxID=208333 RepID=UPI001FAB590A|nr:tubulin epsilon and delta complex protein 2-like isoform X2 [Girardinichthys multiradiatus]